MDDTTRIARDAADLANAIEAVCCGVERVSVYIALASVIGAGAADAERPNLPALLDLIRRSAEFAFERAMEARKDWGPHHG